MILPLEVVGIDTASSCCGDRVYMGICRACGEHCEDDGETLEESRRRGKIIEQLCKEKLEEEARQHMIERLNDRRI